MGYKFSEARPKDETETGSDGNGYGQPQLGIEYFGLGGDEWLD